eukprot:CAMPEP_0183806846 /NCGR_PEP_ID=MMETSP0803_2-20130417/40140_1 /TAXON_ID=195967 /ORGANISM="Crustomastix stigmata, Strain CCMP3273" /LENGTH=59 /DNA_ID=CAMNT_0026051615 /DNA_START=56 /DNA_END=231 /DNA_ORIENTATION=+
MVGTRRNAAEGYTAGATEGGADMTAEAAAAAAAQGGGAAGVVGEAGPASGQKRQRDVGP